MSAYPPVAFPPPPPTSNALSPQRRSALVRSSKKLSKVLGDVPRVLDDDISPLPFSSPLELTRTLTSTSTVPRDTESTWRKRKPTHLPPLLKLSNSPIDTPADTPNSLTGPVYHSPPACHDPALFDALSTASGSSSSSQRRAKLERLRRKLGQEVPASAAFPTTPHTTVPGPTPHTPKTPKPRAPHARSRSVARLPTQADDARSIAFTISSDESVHTVSLTAARVHSPRSRKTRHAYQTGPLPPVPSIPVHLASGSASSSCRTADNDDDDAGLIRPRLKMAAGSMIGGAEFKAARRAKREGRGQNGMAEPGELVEMVGFMF